MTYIVPNGRVQFYKEFGLSPSYENTLYFPTMEARNDYFDNNLTPIAEGTAMTYSRATRGYIRVQLPMATLIHAGYMRFRNTGFENKWFYAFVTNVEYINNECTEVQFELDYMMTWMGAFELIPCLVERMHSLTDNIGDNIVDECLPCGETLYGKPQSSGRLGTWTYCFASTFDPAELDPDPVPEPEPEEPEVELPDPETGETNPQEAGEDDNTNTNPNITGIEIIDPWDGGIYGNIFSGLHYAYSSSETVLKDWIKTATIKGKSDGIIGIAICPSQFECNDGENVKQYTVTVQKPTVGTPFKQGNDSYIPRNNKLYTYPYTFFSLTNMEGNWADYKYEFFDQNTCNFTIQGVSTLNTEIIMSPHNYKWNKDDTLLPGEWVANPGEKMSIADFPLCSFLTDPFMAYLAQNKSSISASVVSTALGAAGQVANMAIGAATGGLTTTLTHSAGVSEAVGTFAGYESTETWRSPRLSANPLISMAQETIKFLGTMADYDRKPMQLNGNQGSSALFGRIVTEPGEERVRLYKEFWFLPRTITPQYARIIDNFFTLYGYKLGQVTTPLMNARPHWTYVKTCGCNVKAKGSSNSFSMPADHARVIERIFDNGVRFWVDHTEIGNYVLDNRPT